MNKIISVNNLAKCASYLKYVSILTSTPNFIIFMQIIMDNYLKFNGK